ncbi:MAG: hypothetical protein HKO92_11445 [Flavobacteriaceae bacterium]|nr:hypothetical protein [Flavobacteriaceae bacterium]
MKCRANTPLSLWEHIKILFIGKIDRHNWKVREIISIETNMMYKYRICECGEIEVYSYKYGTYSKLKGKIWKRDWEAREFLEVLNKDLERLNVI